MEQSPLAIHHVGVAVPSIDDAMQFYGEKLGLSLLETIELPDRQLRVGFVKTSNMLIELGIAALSVPAEALDVNHVWAELAECLIEMASRP